MSKLNVGVGYSGSGTPVVSGTSYGSAVGLPSGLQTCGAAGGDSSYSATRSVLNSRRDQGPHADAAVVGVEPLRRGPVALA